ncbi:MAG: biotin/lipoyl-binding protein [Acidobacteria bacterium]|nr:biotin/lipoyl-binding protein [Acidobacteriota bacterium]
MKGGLDWRIVLGGVAFVAGALGVLIYQQRKAAPAPAPAPAVQSSAPVTELTLAGKIRAKHVLSVAAPMDGTLEGLEVMDGQEVFEGQLLGRIRNSTLETAEEEAKLELDRLQTRLNNLEASLIAARLEASRADADAVRARSQFSAAERTYLKQKSLFQEGATARLTYEKAVKEYETAKSESEAVGEMTRQASSKMAVVQKNIEEAKKLLADKSQDLEDVKSQLLATEVHAPVDGLLVAHKAGNGDEVKRDMADLFQIATDVAELELTVELTPAQAPVLKPGMSAVIQVAEAGNQPIAAMVKSVEGMLAVLEFAAPDAAVKPGLTAQVRVFTVGPPPQPLMPPVKLPVKP